MWKIDWPTYFKRHSLFSTLTESEVQALLNSEVSQELEFEKGEVIIERGVSEDTVFLIGAGSVSVYQSAEDLPNIPLATFVKGDFLGEMAMFEKRKRAATVRANEFSILLEIRGQEFLNLISNHPDIVTKVLSLFSERVRELREEVLALKLAGGEKPSHPGIPKGDSKASEGVSSGSQKSPDHDAWYLNADFPWSVFGKIYHWAWRHPLPPLLGVGVIATAVVLVMLPLLSPERYANLISLVSPAKHDSLQLGFNAELKKELEELKDLRAENEDLKAKIESGQTASGHFQETLKVMALFQDSVNQPWVGTIHRALKEAERSRGISYTLEDKIPAKYMEDRVDDAAGSGDYQLIIGDATDDGETKVEHGLRKVAEKYGKTGPAFVFGSSQGPATPNFSVFESWTYEPAFVAGMIGAALSENRKLGVVAAKNIVQINRIVNAFIGGAKDLRPDVEVMVEIINSWDQDKNKSRAGTKKLIEKGVDFFFAEREGVIQVCRENNIPVIGNMTEPTKDAPETSVVVTNVTWDMSPTLRRILAQLRANIYSAEDYGSWSRMYKEGSALSPFPLDKRWVERIRPGDLKKIHNRYEDIRKGVFRVPIVEIDPREYAKIPPARHS